MMLPIEVIVLGGIISTLSLIERLIRYIPKLASQIERIRRSRDRLETVRTSIRTSNASLEDAVDFNPDDIRDILDIVDTLTDLTEEIGFIKP